MKYCKELYEMAVIGRSKFRKSYQDSLRLNAILRKQMDDYGISLLMIKNGVANPTEFASRTLDKQSEESKKL